MCEVRVTGGTLPQEEINAYIDRAREKYRREPRAIDIAVDGDFVDLRYDFGHVPFDRIRRITGYLVGTLDRFNDAKRCEEHDLSLIHIWSIAAAPSASRTPLGRMAIPAMSSVRAARSSGCRKAPKGFNCMSTAYSAPTAAAQINAVHRTSPRQRAITESASRFIPRLTSK